MVYDFKRLIIILHRINTKVFYQCNIFACGSVNRFAQKKFHLSLSFLFASKATAMSQTQNDLIVVTSSKVT